MALILALVNFFGFDPYKPLWVFFQREHTKLLFLACFGLATLPGLVTVVGAAATVSRWSVAGSNNPSTVWSPHSYHHHHPTILLVLASGKHHYGLNEHLPTPPLEQLHD